MRTVSQALALIRERSAHGAPRPVGMCKEECGTEAYGIPTDGTPDATAAWHATQHRFRGQWVRGAFAWWTGGSHGHGHVAICAWRKGYVWTMDFRRPGMWDRVPISEIERTWTSLKWAGMSLDINGKQVRKLPTIPRIWSH